jgi:hypothetical protein
MQKRSCPATLSANGLVVLLALVVCLFSAFAVWGGSAPGRAEKLRIVDLEGTPFQMGKVHGRTLKVEIQELVRRWKEDIAKTYGVTAEVFIQNLLKKTDFKPAIERWTPGLLDEVRGIADGAGVDFDTMYAYQLIDEVWAMKADLDLSKCTSIAAGKRNGNPAYVAQTLDIPTFYHGFQTVLRIRDKREGLETHGPGSHRYQRIEQPVGRGLCQRRYPTRLFPERASRRLRHQGDFAPKNL